MKTLMCFGDSNTHGSLPVHEAGERARLGPDQRWPGVMAAQLKARGENDWHLIEEGLPGRTILHPDPIEGAHKNGLPGFIAALETHRPLDLIILMLGTNDLKPRFGVTSLDIARSIEKLVMLAKQSDSGPDGAAPELILVAPPPIKEQGTLAGIFTGGEAKSKELAREYAIVAKAHNCQFVDAGEAATVSPVDGIHYEAEEHQKLGTLMAQAVIDGKY